MPTAPPRSNTVGLAAAADCKVDRQEGRGRAHGSGKPGPGCSIARRRGTGVPGRPGRRFRRARLAAATFRKLDGDSASRQTASRRVGREKKERAEARSKQ